MISTRVVALLAVDIETRDVRVVGGAVVVDRPGAHQVFEVGEDIRRVVPVEVTADHIVRIREAIRVARGPRVEQQLSSSRADSMVAQQTAKTRARISSSWRVAVSARLDRKSTRLNSSH